MLKTQRNSMNKNLKKLLALACASYVSVSALTRGTDYGLAFIKVHDHDAMPYMATGGIGSLMHENHQRKQNDDNVGGMISVSARASQIWNGSRGSIELAKGFGIDAAGSNVIRFVGRTATTGNKLSTAPSSLKSNEIDTGSFYNTFTADTANSALETSTLTLEAKHTRWAIDLGYHQDLSNFYEGLYACVNTAFVGVKNHLVATWNVETATSYSKSKLSSMQTFFDGSQGSNDSNTPANNQAALKFGIIDNKERTTEWGLNDIHACLGLKLVDNENASICVAAELVIPTGKQPKGTYLWEPVIGNRFFKTGLKLHANACLAEGSDYKANLNLCGRWLYGWKRETVRLPSFSAEGKAWGQYSLGFKATDKQYSPLLNLLPTLVDIKPQNSLDANAVLNFEKGCLAFDLGYSFQWQQEEKAEVKGNFPTDVYYMASTVVDPTNGLAKPANDVGIVKLADVNYGAGSQANHRVFTSVGFCCTDWQYPASFNVFGGYNFAHNRTRNPETWDLGFKGSFCF